MNSTKNNYSNNGNRFEIIFPGNTDKSKNYIINEDCRIRLWSRIYLFQVNTTQGHNEILKSNPPSSLARYFVFLIFFFHSNSVLISNNFKLFNLKNKTKNATNFNKQFNTVQNMGTQKYCIKFSMNGSLFSNCCVIKPLHCMAQRPGH